MASQTLVIDVLNRLQNPPAPAQHRRRHGRIRCEDLDTCFGEAVNLSMAGMQVVSQKPAKNVSTDEQIEVQLRCAEHVVTVSARIVWKRSEADEHLMGVEFVNVASYQREVIRRIMRSAMDSRTFAAE